jgi:hypothetical protein
MDTTREPDEVLRSPPQADAGTGKRELLQSGLGTDAIAIRPCQLVRFLVKPLHDFRT